MTVIATVIDNLAVSFGRSTREAIEQLGAIAIFFAQCMRAVPGAWMRFHIIMEQMMRMGVQSLPIIWIASTFVGFIAAWQVQYLASDIVPLSYLGAAVGKVIFTDLGPAFTALILAGRISAKLAAEIGTMRVTDQIDAMKCLALDPYRYLLAPRILSGFVMTPILMIFSFFFSIISAQFLAAIALDVNFYTFYNGVKMLFLVRDVMIGLVKGFVFGGVVSLTGCYFGFNTTGGAVGVGEATKKAVVSASVLIIIFNLIINQFLLR